MPKSAWHIMVKQHRHIDHYQHALDICKCPIYCFCCWPSLPSKQR